VSDKTAWEQAASAEGTTESERALSKLARKAFLSLWSYSNVFTDEGRSAGKGDGKELCDLLVVFGNNVLLFSDKHCAFQLDKDIRIAWPRWYKKAIEKSAAQLVGAENFIKRFPLRVFLDKACQHPLPVALPDPAVANYFLIAVTRGSHIAAREYFGGGSSGSFMLRNDLRGRDHFDMPFQVGFPLATRRFVHVLDEMVVDILLEELDTVPDLVSYLRCKEQFFGEAPTLITVAGEEDLLARYMTTIRDDEHALPRIPKGADGFALQEGDWAVYAASPQRAAKRKADQVSYLWDSLIEYQSSFIRAGTAVTVPNFGNEQVDHERVVRALAEQNRLRRRDLSGHLRFVLERPDPQGAFTRVRMVGRPLDRAFVFMSAVRDPSMTYEAYRESRMHSLTVYCHTIKEAIPTLKEAIGIASEPFSELASSQDFLYVDLSGVVTPKETKFWRDQADELGILRPKTQVRLGNDQLPEFPSPYVFTNTDQYMSVDGMPMNRAARRQAAKEARRAKK